MVASKADAGISTAIEPEGLNSRKSLGLGPQDVFRMEFQDFWPCLRDHCEVFTSQLGTNEECKCVTDCKLICCKVSSYHTILSVVVQQNLETVLTLLEILLIHEVVEVWFILHLALILSSFRILILAFTTIPI